MRTERVSLIPSFSFLDFIYAAAILLAISWVYLFIQARKHQQKFDELRFLAKEKVEAGEADKEKVKEFLKSAEVKIRLNQILKLLLLFLTLSLCYYLLEFAPK